MSVKRLAELADAMRSRRLVRISRRFESWTITGYVLDVGPRFFLLWVVSDLIRFDGFQCFRCTDVKNLQPDPHAAFVEAALKERGDRRPRKPRVSVASISELLLSAGRAFPLLTIHRERVDPDVCWIGRVLGIDRGRLSLLEIDTDAKWENSSEEHRIAEITRVDFGGDYENALYAVGGVPRRVDSKGRR
jgi:hypothetical protein